ncbi:DUF58 domain-containing protein [Salinibacterium hongtaonis]|uniref:DUF58 domain-containing protein n=1 Tax=Homoserinimonas hongtaonis TaxID=2079791 RepID=UPI000D3338A2|nr:DUF58 domain-containing protein [Salinibacterium hongtaonis]AWB89641.1 hypothetical protein C2138_08875 [Salinibacterium hongtaonis]
MGRRRRLDLTGRGRAVVAAAVSCIIAAYATGIDAFLLVGSFLVGAVVFSLFSAHHRRPVLSVHRTFGGGQPMVGNPVSVAVDIVNLSPRATGTVTWSDGSATGTGVSPEGVLPELRGRRGDVVDSCRVQWSFVPPHRGDMGVGPLRLGVEDPFGFARAAVSVGELTEITVVPRHVPLPGPGVLMSDADGSARRSNPRSVGGEHDITTRGYRVGDPLRRVHWRASAHHGQLMVRQEEQRSNAVASILLETRAVAYQDDLLLQMGDSDEFEWAVSMVASLVTHLDAEGFTVNIIESGRPQLTGAVHPLIGLARVELTDESRPDGIVLAPEGQNGSSGLGVVFAVVADLDAAMVAALTTGRARYGAAVLFVRARGVPSDLELRLRVMEQVGWRCVIVDDSMSIEQAWLSVSGATRAGGGGRGAR